MNTYTFRVVANVGIEATDASDAKDLLEDYLGDLGPDVHIEIESVEDAN